MNNEFEVPVKSIYSLRRGAILTVASRDREAHGKPHLGLTVSE